MPFQKFHLPRLIEFTHTLFYLWEITDKNKRQSWNWTWNLLQWTKKVFVETIYLKLWVKKRFKTTSFPWKGHTGVKLLGLCRKHKNGDKEHGITGIFWLKGDNILCALYTQNKLQVQLFQSQFDLPLSPLCVQFVKTKYIKGFVHILQCWLILWKTQGSKMCPWNPKCLQRTLSPDLPQNFQFLLPQPIFFFFSKISFETSYLSFKAPVLSEEPPGCSRSFPRTQLGFARGSTGLCSSNCHRIFQVHTINLLKTA